MMSDAPPDSTAQQLQQRDPGAAARASPAQMPSQQPSAAPVSCYNFQPVNVNGNIFHNNPPLPTAASLHHPTSALQPAGLTSAQHPASPPTYQQP